MGSTTDDDNEEVPLSEQTRRPLDTAFRQQRVNAWYPVLDPWYVAGVFIALAAIFIPTGLKMLQLSDAVEEFKVQYDAYDNPHPECGINTTANAKTPCSISFTTKKDMQAPVLVYYEIENFYQNHRQYSRSRDNYQLAGSITQDSLSAQLCDPLNFLGSIKLNPCGLMANTFFNDIIKLRSGPLDAEGIALSMLEDGIAWQSDIDYKFKQPDGFNYELCPDGTNVTTCCNGDQWSCTNATEYNGQLYRYYYPEDSTTQYLYETYPDIVSPIEGVQNEHFVVWMRTATLPTFRKLYGWINQNIPAGTNITFDIVNNWDVTSFNGGKSLIMTTNNIFGGKNNWSGLFYFSVGVFCGAAGLFFLLKQFISPRRTADKKYLQYKTN